MDSFHSELIVHSAKFLGIYIDEHLRCSEHLGNLKLQCCKVIYGIKRIRELTDEKTALLAYYAMFHSKICYIVTTVGDVTL